ncbi:MAG: hypothetical protein J0H42_04300 [Rhizobiales bacterium]|nr:hypothetical protein [Hyphomicrobiales bacterium]
MPRLSKLEKEMLQRAAQFVLAGEWPWEGDGSVRANKREVREAAALENACVKLVAENKRQ